jgi:hypothetical protein
MNRSSKMNEVVRDGEKTMMITPEQPQICEQPHKLGVTIKRKVLRAISLLA